MRFVWCTGHQQLITTHSNSLQLAETRNNSYERDTSCYELLRVVTSPGGTRRVGSELLRVS